MKNICFVVGAGEFSESGLGISPGDIVIAADGGYEHLKRIGLEADIVLGDFDSSEAPRHPNVIRHPAMKDDTDMMLAVKTGLEMGYKNFILLGGLGGRLDHTFSNIQALVYLSRRGARACLAGGDLAITAVTDSALKFTGSEQGLVSVFCSGDNAEGVSLNGLKYPLSDAVLAGDMPIGVSNEFTGEAAEISVRKGTLVIFWNDCLEKIINMW